jgi:hypothetical protein
MTQAASDPSPMTLRSLAVLRWASAVAALIVGAISIAATRAWDVLGPLATMPLFQLLGLGAAVAIAPFLGPRVAVASPATAFVFTLVYGALVPAAVGGLLGILLLPLLPIVIGVSMAAWPLTMPAAFAWAALLRWRRSRDRLGSPATAALVGVLALLVVALRFTQPLITRSEGGALCASYPGESIEVIAWSPGGRWLAFASRHGYTRESIRIVDAESGRIHDLVSGEGVMATFGMALDDAGQVTYQAPASGAAAPRYAEDLALWVTSARDEPRSIGVVPGVVMLVGTTAGVAGIIESTTSGRYERTAVWLRSGSAGVELVPLTADELAEHPEAGIALANFEGSFAVRLATGTYKVTWPNDVTYDLSITPDHRHLVFQARHLSDDGNLDYERLVAQSVETGARTVIREGGGSWGVRVAGGRVASIGYPEDENRLCVAPLGASLGLTPP